MVAQPQKPTLFLDFDHTLFDTDQLRAWLGLHIESRIKEIELGTLSFPDLTMMLYPDTLAFLKSAKRVYQIVLLTYTVNQHFQKGKISGSGIADFLDDTLITTNTSGDSGKGKATKEYLANHGAEGGGHVFVDDLLENISEVKKTNPNIRCIQIERAPSKNVNTSSVGFLAPDDRVKNLAELLRLLPRIATS